MYETKPIPKNFGLFKRLATEVKPSHIVNHSRRILTTQMFQNGSPSSVITPNAIYVDPSYICNRRCVGCYIEVDGRVIDQGLAEEVCDYSLNNGVNYIAWLGGEPFHPKIRDLVIDVTADFPSSA
jgi:sulfatase maturation enzyme AslB (radical SAM superfamily)